MRVDMSSLSVTLEDGSYSTSHLLALEILASLPPARFAFSYGSAVFPQAQNNINKRGGMLDLVLAVDDAEQWHAENLVLNRAHYSRPLADLGARAISRVQKWGPSIYYNTLMPARKDMPHFKYGVITVDDLKRDLRTWKHLYVAGRAHKPIRVLGKEHNNNNTARSQGLKEALDHNIQSAAAAALLLQPGEAVKEESIYISAASLSYTGDVRIESRNKVPSIVKANLPYFRRLYQPILKKLPVDLRSSSSSSTISSIQDLSSSATYGLLKRLPSQVQTELRNYEGLHGNHHLAPYNDNDDIAHRLSLKNRSYVSKAVSAAIAAIVTRSSIQQSTKGLFTAGLSTSTKYIAAKVAKSIRSRF